ncbi:ATP-binding protein [Streptomyces sp. NPDC050535]|uniref:ATP-binding protein n=1 Tax=Streptomyces sp. NPDC050535 TaxID=3365626 RepID=UPI0037B59AB7
MQGSEPPDSVTPSANPGPLPCGTLFLAEPKEVASLRRALKAHLGIWGLHELMDAAQLCLSELVANVINHVDAGIPTTFAVSMNDTHLRIEVHDPDPRALPTPLSANADAESERGTALVDAIADRWGVQLSSLSEGDVVRALHVPGHTHWTRWRLPSNEN